MPMGHLLARYKLFHFLVILQNAFKLLLNCTLFLLVCCYLFGMLIKICCHLPSHINIFRRQNSDTLPLRRKWVHEIGRLP